LGKYPLLKEQSLWVTLGSERQKQKGKKPLEKQPGARTTVGHGKTRQAKIYFVKGG